ncbi:divalent-cation tolerance protein CutA [Azospirillum sp. RWY-5-1]|uniref:Divalent-cation tolerance protein CutA n=1 Tax=Azospirillum oleiclasticum TaxID=2735135 RepID=A0ABX2T5L5_9PROT|nr:divalent-cation tolerance protein CutA [Azospirillum oleiclasticum]NYZ11277.1 divalent-cation tolerance protein CutA [Azospirillum oleiclasticum]NYZ18438.1 divalent-cation tolerance protein CutA [Azospirillum oleiclasticum]
MIPTFVYMTAGTREEAERIGRALVEERLAACVNILPGMLSVYRWKGAVEQAEEVVLLAKTRRSNFTALAERVRALHSYEVPCIVELPLGQGDAPYLDWIAAETDLG